MILKTYNEWKAKGMYVIKGEHACHRENGRCYFNENQVISLEDAIQDMKLRKARMTALHDKLKSDQEDFKNNRHKYYVEDCLDRHSKEETLSWLSYQGSSIYNEQCPDLDGLSVSDALNEIF